MGKLLAAGLRALMLAAFLGACNPAGVATTPPSTASPNSVAVVASDYAFTVPAAIQGGLLTVSFTNSGQEPHFAGFAKVADGKTFEDAKAALTAAPGATPPQGPPPFEDVAGIAATDPGATASMTVNLPAGTYALFCSIPSPDGTPHAVKGMITALTVSEGVPGELPAAAGTITATDFLLSDVPPLMAGKNVVGLKNDGKQLHEINLVELGPDSTIEDVIAWYRQPAGPPPMRSLGGVAVKPGTSATTELELKAGASYAFVCAIPDFLGDFAPHITKGMFSPAFSVS